MRTKGSPNHRRRTSALLDDTIKIRCSASWKELLNDTLQNGMMIKRTKMTGEFIRYAVLKQLLTDCNPSYIKAIQEELEKL